MRALAHSVAALSAVAAAPIALGMMAVQPRWRVGVRERLGAAMSLPPGLIWIHAASVGEILAASRLVDRLRAAGRDVYTSTFTVSGRDVMRRTRPEVPCELAPLDHPWCTGAALDRVQPAAVVLVEGELWPNWIAAAQRRNIPVLLVSARMSARSYRRYRRLGRFAARTMQRLSWVGARTPEDAERFRGLGAEPDRISIIGDLKVDVEDDRRPMTTDLAHGLRAGSLLVAGSTHSGEEAIVLDAFGAVRSAGFDLSLVLAPRHVERAGEVERLIRDAGWTPRRRNAIAQKPLTADEVLVLDSVGELAALYARADVAFVGGSLVPVGGHNVLEPVFAGRPVLYGEHTVNVRHAIEILEPCGAGRAVSGASDLSEAVIEVLRDPAQARDRAESGRRALEEHRGSSERAGALIDSVLATAREA